MINTHQDSRTKTQNTNTLYKFVLESDYFITNFLFVRLKVLRCLLNCTKNTYLIDFRSNFLFVVNIFSCWFLCNFNNNKDLIKVYTPKAYVILFNISRSIKMIPETCFNFLVFTFLYNIISTYWLLFFCLINLMFNTKYLLLLFLYIFKNNETKKAIKCSLLLPSLLLFVLIKKRF